MSIVFSSKIYTQYPIITRQTQGFRKMCKLFYCQMLVNPVFYKYSHPLLNILLNHLWQYPPTHSSLQILTSPVSSAGQPFLGLSRDVLLDSWLISGWATQWHSNCSWSHSFLILASGLRLIPWALWSRFLEESLYIWLLSSYPLCRLVA